MFLIPFLIWFIKSTVETSNFICGFVSIFTRLQSLNDQISLLNLTHLIKIVASNVCHLFSGL